MQDKNIISILQESLHEDELDKLFNIFSSTSNASVFLESLRHNDLLLISQNTVEKILAAFSDLQSIIDSLKIELDESKNNLTKYSYGSIQILDNSGNIICELDEWVSSSLIEAAVETFIIKSIAKSVEL